MENGVVDEFVERIEGLANVCHAVHKIGCHDFLVVVGMRHDEAFVLQQICLGMPFGKFFGDGFALVIFEQSEGYLELALVQNLLEFVGMVGYYLADFIERFFLRHPDTAGYEGLSLRLDVQVISCQSRLLSAWGNGCSEVGFEGDFIFHESGIFVDAEHTVLRTDADETFIEDAHFMYQLIYEVFDIFGGSFVALSMGFKPRFIVVIREFS